MKTKLLLPATPAVQELVCDQVADDPLVDGW